MRVYWANEGEAVEGIYTATVDMEDGSGVQVFEGNSHKDVADKLLVAQANATQKIREQNQQLTTRTETPAKPAAKPATRPQPLSADRRFVLAQEITDPAKSPEAITEVVEAMLGLPLSEVKERLARQQEKDTGDEIKVAAQAFRDETEDYFFCDHNARLLTNYMQLHGMDPKQKDDYVQAFNALKELGLMVFKQQDSAAGTKAEAGPERIAPTTRPRGVVSSTGLRIGDSSHDQGGAPARGKYTAEDIQNMPETEYRRKLTSEPGFAQLVDKLMAPKARG